MCMHSVYTKVYLKVIHNGLQVLKASEEIRFLLMKNLVFFF